MEPMTKTVGRPAMKIPCTIVDRYEGTLHVIVEAIDEDAADEEASIAAAERGCRDVFEIVVGVHE